MELAPIGTREAARILGYTPRTVTRLAGAGKLAYVAKLDGATSAYIFDRATVEAHAAHRTRLADLIINGTAPTVVVTDEALTASSTKRGAA